MAKLGAAAGAFEVVPGLAAFGVQPLICGGGDFIGGGSLDGGFHGSQKGTLFVSCTGAFGGTAPGGCCQGSPPLLVVPGCFGGAELEGLGGSELGGALVGAFVGIAFSGGGAFTAISFGGTLEGAFLAALGAGPSSLGA